MKRYLTGEIARFEQMDLHAHMIPTEPEMRLVKVYPYVQFQQVVGFGAALTEASGYVYAQMDERTREEFVQLCFGPEGNRYSLARVSVQSCDFSLGPRAYMDDSSDKELSTFSVDDDEAFVLPLVRAACRANGELEVLASPWSPPAWAKSNLTMKLGGHLRKRHYETWARMVARFVADYRERGVPVTRLTVQNEPEATQKWESCRFSAGQERTFLSEYLKPALRDAGVGDVKVLVWDHNKERVLDRVIGMMCGETGIEDFDGVGFHWYSGDHFEALRTVRDVIGPERELIFTEGCDFFTGGEKWWELPHAEHYAREVIGDLEAGANGIIDWNILLDAKGGPNHVGNFCDAPIMYDVETRQMNVRLPFHYLGHFSRFIQPGARRMLTTRYTTSLETTAFANPDGSHALVVLNRTSEDIPFTLAWGSGLLGSRSVDVSAPARSIQTIVW